VSSYYSTDNRDPSSLAGVDINTIRAWLGHVSLNTTNIYAEVDLEMKAKALATCEIHGTVPLKHWKEDTSLMQFLQAP
jgi:integrase/recombinase XerD